MSDSTHTDNWERMIYSLAVESNFSQTDFEQAFEAGNYDFEENSAGNQNLIAQLMNQPWAGDENEEAYGEETGTQVDQQQSRLSSKQLRLALAAGLLTCFTAFAVTMNLDKLSGLIPDFLLNSGDTEEVLILDEDKRESSGGQKLITSKFETTPDSNLEFVENSRVGGGMLSTERTTYYSGESIRVSWEGAPGNPGDTISIYAKHQWKEDCVGLPTMRWKYAGGTAGSVTIDYAGKGPAWPLPVGKYEIYYLLNNGYCEWGPPVSITVVPAKLDATLTSATISNGTQGNLTRVIVRGKGKAEKIVAGTYDSAVVKGKVEGANSADIAFIYIGNDTYCGIYLAAKQGTDTISITLDGVSIGGSPYIQTISSPSRLRINKTNYAQGEDIVVSWTGAPGNKKDWIGIYAVGQYKTDCYNPKGVLLYAYTSGTSSESLIINGEDIYAGKWPLSNWIYEVNYLLDDGYCEWVPPVIFTVGSPYDSSKWSEIAKPVSPREQSTEPRIEFQDVANMSIINFLHYANKQHYDIVGIYIVPSVYEGVSRTYAAPPGAYQGQIPYSLRDPEIDWGPNLIKENIALGGHFAMGIAGSPNGHYDWRVDFAGQTEGGKPMRVYYPRMFPSSGGVLTNYWIKKLADASPGFTHSTGVPIKQIKHDLRNLEKQIHQVDDSLQERIRALEGENSRLVSVNRRLLDRNKLLQLQSELTESTITELKQSIKRKGIESQDNRLKRLVDALELSDSQINKIRKYLYLTNNLLDPRMRELNDRLIYLSYRFEEGEISEAEYQNAIEDLRSEFADGDISEQDLEDLFNGDYLVDYYTFTHKLLDDHQKTLFDDFFASEQVDQAELAAYLGLIKIITHIKLDENQKDEVYQIFYDNDFVVSMDELAWLINEGVEGQEYIDMIDRLLIKKKVMILTNVLSAGQLAVFELILESELEVNEEK